MRAYFFLGAVGTTACAGSYAMPAVATADFVLALTRTSNEGRPVLVVTMTNRSQADVCIRAELLKNPNTYEMDIRLRDGNGSSVKFKDVGFLREPIMDPVRITPGLSVQGHYYLDARFNLPGDGKRLPNGASARVALHYDGCDGSLSQQATSAWQRI
jgi:hypothetical protein